jgi:hypothetical protein
LKVRLLLAIALLCVAVSACGGGGDSNDESSRLQVAIDQEAQALAESMLLQLTDFPDGWRAGEPSEEDEEGDEAFRDCVGVDFSDFTVVGEARSDDFAMGETATASSDAKVFETEGMAADAIARFADAFDSAEADACMSDFLGEFEDESVEVTGAEVGELSFIPPSGVDDAEAWQVVINVEGKAGSQAEGVSATGYVDLVQLRSGAGISEVTTVDVFSPFDAELRDQLVAAVAGRMSE